MSNVEGFYKDNSSYMRKSRPPSALKDLGRASPEVTFSAGDGTAMLNIEKGSSGVFDNFKRSFTSDTNCAI